MQNTNRINCCLMRGGTSKGVIFNKSDLPEDIEKRNEIILKIMGAPDPYGLQIQGLGGGKSINNKVAIVNKSSREGLDIDYLFLQVLPNSNIINTGPNCGNFSAAAAMYAVHKRLVTPKEPTTLVKMYNLNTKQIIHAKLPSNNQGTITKGGLHLNGVSGEFAPIDMRYFNFIGCKTGKLLPSGKPMDIINNIEISCIDAGTLIVCINGANLGINSGASAQQLNSATLIAQLEEIRSQACKLMGRVYDGNSVLPKIVILTPPLTAKANIRSYYYDPFNLHPTLAVTGAMAIAASAFTKGTVANKLLGNGYNVKAGADHSFVIEHQAGTLPLVIQTNNHAAAQAIEVQRTASVLMDGTGYF